MERGVITGQWGLAPGEEVGHNFWCLRDSFERVAEEILDTVSIKNLMLCSVLWLYRKHVFYKHHVLLKAQWEPKYALLGQVWHISI